MCGIRNLFVGLLAALALAAGPVAGQVAPVQGGQVLDANPRIGDRYNTAAPVQPFIDSQLYVTGQVSGLAGFHGRAGYYAGNELNLTLPSQGLDTFRRQSVGLDQVLGGRSYQTSPYYNRSSTTLSLENILSGQAIPGSDVPRSSPAPLSALGRNLYVDALADYTSVAPLVPGAVVVSEARSGGLMAPGGGPLTQALPSPGATTESEAFAPGGTALFGIPRAKEQIELAKELYSQRHEALRDEMRDQRVQARIGEPAETEPLVGMTDVAGLGEAAGRETMQTPGGPIGRPIGGAAIGQDVFLDMLRQLRRVRQGRETAGGQPTSQPAAAGGSSRLIDAPPPESPEARAGAGEGRVVLHSLAGNGPDMLNFNLARAQKDLSAKKYYDAAYLYETAGLISPQNPLPRVGMGLALFGAGEPAGAAYQLRRAMSLFPPLMETDIDLSAMMDRGVILAQLAALERALGAKDKLSNPALLTFLATFLYRNSQQMEKAKVFAEKLRLLAEKDALLRAYADYVLTGRRPNEAAKAATRAPAETPASPPGETPPQE